jgi:hypothetical protein
LKKNVIYICILLALVISLFISWRIYKEYIYHSKITLEEVENITLRQEADNVATLTKEQQKGIVEAFNSAEFIDDNDRLAGPTYMCAATIHLKSGKSISIGGCGRENEVQRDDNIRFGNKSTTGGVTYIIESKELEQIFNNLTQ